MQFYERVLGRVNGALAAHFGRSLSEQYKLQVLGFVYSQKYEYQLRFDNMQVVGRQANGQVEAVLTPTGLIKRIRVHPDITRLPLSQRRMLITSAVCEAKQKGRKLMEQAELQVYGRFLRDIKPWVCGVRDNPEFFTIPEDAVETPSGIIAPKWMTPEHVHRTIPFQKWQTRQSVHNEMKKKEEEWLNTKEGFRWTHSQKGRQYMDGQPDALPRGAPGRIYSESKANENVAYDPALKKKMKKLVKDTNLAGLWFGCTGTDKPSAQAIDNVLLKVHEEELQLRAARVDWTVVRADDRARAKREAQDQGLEPHFQNAPKIDLRRHWFVKRREVNADALYGNYDVMRPTDKHGPINYLQQYTRRQFSTPVFERIRTMHDAGRWNVSNNAIGTDAFETHDMKGWLGNCMLPTESWQSRLSYYPEASAKF